MKTQIPLSKEGYLIDYQLWDENLAMQFAKDVDVSLTDAHWQIIYFLRKYYQQYENIPPLRLMVRAIRKEFGEAVGNSLYLHKLFPEGVLRIACKIAGLPRPKHCM